MQTIHDLITTHTQVVLLKQLLPDTIAKVGKCTRSGSTVLRLWIFWLDLRIPVVVFYWAMTEIIGFHTLGKGEG